MLKTVEEIMVPMRQYPHAPASLSIADALQIMKLPRWGRLNDQGHKTVPHDLLVFNDDLEFMGIVRRRDMLRALQPALLHPGRVEYRERQFSVNPDVDILALSGDEGLSEEKVIENMRRRASKPVEEIMIPLDTSINHDARLMHVVHEVVSSRTGCLPVVKESQVVGMIRSEGVLREIERLLGIKPPQQETQQDPQ